jgi:hypothetical protein
MNFIFVPMSGNSPLRWKLLLIQDQDFELPEHDYALVARPCQLSRAYAGGCGYGQ